MEKAVITIVRLTKIPDGAWVSSRSDPATTPCPPNRLRAIRMDGCNSSDERAPGSTGGMAG